MEGDIVTVAVVVIFAGVAQQVLVVVVLICGIGVATVTLSGAVIEGDGMYIGAM